MKTIVIILIIVLTVLACGCLNQAPAKPQVPEQGVAPPVPEVKALPDLTGIWSGNATGHTAVEGFVRYPASFNISAQKGQAFSGRKEYVRGDGKTYYENFSGIITLSGEIYESDGGAGYGIGRMTGPDTIEIRYLEDGPDTKAYLVQLTRQKT
jgi:hypothetical protein